MLSCVFACLPLTLVVILFIFFLLPQDGCIGVLCLLRCPPFNITLTTLNFDAMKEKNSSGNSNNEKQQIKGNGELKYSIQKYAFSPLFNSTLKITKLNEKSLYGIECSFTLLSTRFQPNGLAYTHTNTHRHNFYRKKCADLHPP